MIRRFWEDASSIALAIFVILGNLGCSNGPISDEPGPSSKKNNLEIPAVSFTNPPHEAKSQALDTAISASFNMAMDPSTISTNSFKIQDAKGALVTGSVGMDPTNKTATFRPSKPLACDTTYTAIINTKAQCDGPGEVSEPLPQDYMWDFQTSPCEQNFPIAGPTPIVAPTPVVGPIPVPIPLPPPFPGLIGGGGSRGHHERERCLRSNIILNTSPLNDQTGVPLNTLVSAAFSRDMEGSSFTTSTFILTGPGLTPVSGSVTYNVVSRVATFTPSSNLLPNTLYTATIIGDGDGIRDSRGDELCRDYSFSFTTGTTLDTAPTIIANSPICTSIDVPTNQIISVTFSEAMDTTSITNLTVTLTGPGPALVAGSVVYDPNSHIVTFTPTALLSPNTSYTFRIQGAPNGVRDLAGIYLASDFVCSFTTASGPDTTPPVVIADIPTCGATGVPLNQIVSATFSKPMNPLTINTSTFRLTGPGPAVVPGTVNYAVNSHIATFTPSALLLPNTTYILTIVGAPNGVQDANGNFLASTYVCSFTTGTGPDITPPTVVSTSPTPCGTTGVSVNQSIIVTFSEPMLASSVNASTFLVESGSTPVAGTVSLNAAGTVATFTPSSPLLTSTVYTFTIKGGASGVKDLAGNALVADFICSFTTSPSSGGQTPINLGTAASFEILAMDTITNSGATVVTGDVGLRPGTAITGFPPGIVLGTVHVNDTAVTNAQADLLIAYNDAAGRSGGISLPGELSGLTLAPGLYTNASSVSNLGTVTLNAQGDANAVFIFQIGSSLTAGVGSQVILAGNAQASNIFWQVGSSAILNSNSIFKGTIMALTSISTGAGTAIDGGLFAAATHVGGAVTLISTTASVP